MTHICPDPHLSPLEHHLDRLKHAGYKLTHARVTVMQVIQQWGGHLTSAQVLEAVTQVDASIGRASVFRTLELLTRVGIIRPTFMESSATPSYVLMSDGHHHHIVCTACHRTIEFQQCGLKAIAQELEQTLGVKLSGHLVEFYGICAECQQQPLALADAEG